jgi:hypothetical protein
VVVKAYSYGLLRRQTVGWVAQTGRYRANEDAKSRRSPVSRRGGFVPASVS